VIAIILVGSGFAHFVGGQAVGIGVGIVIGAFIPAIGRKIKAFFVKEAAAVKAKL
jgi:hypothetical protein